MEIERVNDSNYREFCGNERAVLAIGTSWCSHCERFGPVLDALAVTFPEITFGRAVLDKGHLIQLKCDLGDFLNGLSIPATLLIKKQGQDQQVEYFSGFMPYCAALAIIAETVLGEEVPLPDLLQEE